MVAVSKTENRSLFSVVWHTFGWPLFWGLGACVCFYFLIHNRIFNSPLVNRYLTGHPVEYVEAALFFIGLAALTIQAFKVMSQFSTLDEVRMPLRTDGGQSMSEVNGMLTSLNEFPVHVRESILVRRISGALEYIRRKGSAAGLEEELKHQSELEAVRQHEGYGLVRMIIWATPMLGFLGTVVGITLALGTLSPQALVETPEQAMEGLLAGLSVAFDTTALALCLSITLMFCQFVVSRLESALSETVDARVSRELQGRFPDIGRSTDDPNVTAIQMMSQDVLESIKQANVSSLAAADAGTRRQAEIWNDAVRESKMRWDDVTKSLGINIKEGMEAAFISAMRKHTEELARNEEVATRNADHRWEQWQGVLKENARIMQQQQTELVKQGDLMLQSINAAGEVGKLQDALNENMRSLSLVTEFDQTISSLSAAVNLLNARLGAPRENVRKVRLYKGEDRRAA